MSTQDGGPAFPVQDAATWQAHGMTLRDYFAAKAMAAIVQAETSNGFATEPEDTATIANAAYFMADQMLKARQQ